MSILITSLMLLSSSLYKNYMLWLIIRIAKAILMSNHSMWFYKENKINIT